MPTEKNLNRWQRYAIALALAAVSVLVQQGVGMQALGPRAPLLLVLPAAVLAAVYLGRGPGLVVLGAGMAVALSGLAPAQGLQLERREDQWLAAIYALVGVGMVQIGAHVRRAMRTALASEQRRGRVVEGAGIGLFEVDLRHATVLLSATLARLLQMDGSPEPMGLGDWLAQLPPDTAHRLQEILTRIRSDGHRSFQHELRLCGADGAARWVLLSGHAATDDRGQVCRVYGAGIDISPRKRAEDELQRAQAALGEQLDDLRRLHELSSRLLEPGPLDEQMRKVLRTALDIHRSAHGLITLSEQGRIWVVAQEGFSDLPMERLESLARTGGICEIAMRERTRTMITDLAADARCRPLLSVASAKRLRAAHALPLINEAGELLGAMSVFLDEARSASSREKAAMDMCANKAVVFMERARSRAALEESQHRFEAVLEASAVPFFVLRPIRHAQGKLEDFRLDYLNTAAARVLGRSRLQLQGMALLEVIPGCWHLIPEVFAHYQAALDHDETREFEVTMTMLPGRQSFHCVASPMGQALAVWAADVTERKRHEQLLQEADRRKDEFLATLAHELRNPLAPIRQAANLSKSPTASEAQKRWSHEVIERQVQHMALLLDDLLDISRITRGALSLRLDRAELSAIVDAAVEAARPLMDAKRHTLVVDLPPQPIRFDADVLRMSQVVANLLTNAARYTDPQGRIRLRAWAAEGQVCIEVSDNGIGIPPDSLDAVFNMFTQLRQGGESRLGGGLGIGLALTRGLVELHGGSISAHSQGLGHGSTFRVRIPMAHISLPAQRKTPAPAPEPAQVVPRHILVADDNRDAAESLAVLLQLQGHRVTCAFDGLQAVAAFEKSPAEICLLDIGMPRLDGNEVARAIRALPGGDKPVLVAITGWGQETDRHQALAAGFDHHLTKPVDPDRLMQLIAEAGGHAEAAHR